MTTTPAPLTIECIPAIDLMQGRIVRLSRGDYATAKCYDDRPADYARHLEQLGYRRLHVVDLEGAKSNRIMNRTALSQIVSNTHLSVDFGGGIKSEAAALEAFELGAQYITLGSLAVTNRALTLQLIHRFGPEHVILGADVLDGQIRINGWIDNAYISLGDFVDSYLPEGITRVLCTDISRDGMLGGPATQLYARLLTERPQLQLIASGGVSSIADIEALQAAGVAAVVIGKAFYEGRIDPAELAARAGLSSVNKNLHHGAC